MRENKRTWSKKLKLSLYALENRISGSEQARYQTKAEWKKAVFRQEILLQLAKSAAFLLATVALIQGVVRVLPDSITVSNTVNGRELPIYCVQTDEMKVALSFDAAWGDSHLWHSSHCRVE